MKIVLTDRRIARLPIPPAGQRLEVRDLRAPGLVLRVTPHGAKTFCVRYRVGERTLRYTIGRLGPFDARRARKVALEILCQAAQGEDPIRRKRQQTVSGRTAHTLLIETVIERYLAEWLPRRIEEGALKPVYVAECARLLRKEVLPRWKGKRLDHIQALDLTNLLDAISAKSTRRHTYFALRAFCQWAQGAGLVKANPIPANYPNPAKPKERERLLLPTELRQIWTHVWQQTSAFQCVVALLLLTGQRRDEVADAEWAEFDLATALWTIPSHRTKNGRAHHVPLSATAIELLSALPSRGQRFVFPGRGGKRETFSGWSRSKARFDRQTGVTGWTLHDLRRTVATCLAERGTQPHVIERLLNHSTGVVSGVAAIYNRASYVAEMRQALDGWSDHLQGMNLNSGNGPTFSEAM